MASQQVSESASRRQQRTGNRSGPPASSCELRA